MSDFSDFDDYFSPSEPKKFLNINDLPVGDYEFQIQKAEATQLMKTGEKIVDFSLLVTKGPMQGSTVSRTYFFRTDMSVNMFGADLVLLGLPAQTWEREDLQGFHQGIQRQRREGLQEPAHRWNHQRRSQGGDASEQR